MTQSFEKFLVTLRIVPIDAAIVEFSRTFISLVAGSPREPIVRAIVGPLGGLLKHLFPSDPYPEPNYPFLQWTDDIHLRIRLFGTQRRLCDCISKQALNRSTFAASLPAIDAALAPDVGQIGDRVDCLLRETPQVVKSAFSSESALQAAARVALLSTQYTRRLMRSNAATETGMVRTLAGSAGLPHVDERNLLYLPVSVSGDRIGGAALCSHYQLPEWSIPVLAGGLHLLLYRIRSGDDIAGAAQTARQKAQWDTTLLYIHRLAHDVRKPAQQVQTALSDAINKYRSFIPADFSQTLEGVLKQITQMRDLIATRVGTSVEDLRAQARRDARPDNLYQLLEDATWLWKLRARRDTKNIEISTEPSHGPVVTLPRFLLVEVLENLVSNAIRFARATVRVRAVLAADKKPRTITFTVQDDGPGFSEEIRKRLFIPYYATDQAQSLPGLGLHLSRFIIKELLDGDDLKISSSPDGTTVSFTVPEALDA